MIAPTNRKYLRLGVGARKIATTLVRVYQVAISPLFFARCRFYPTCSQYTLEAITKFGVLKGIWLGVVRLLRCQPFCLGGIDPVPDQFAWLPSRAKRTEHDHTESAAQRNEAL